MLTSARAPWSRACNSGLEIESKVLYSRIADMEKRDAEQLERLAQQEELGRRLQGQAEELGLLAKENLVSLQQEADASRSKVAEMEQKLEEREEAYKDLQAKHASLEKVHKLLDYVHTMSVRQNQEREDLLKQRVAYLEFLINQTGVPWHLLPGCQRVSSSSCVGPLCGCTLYCVVLRKPCSVDHAQGLVSSPHQASSLRCLRRTHAQTRTRAREPGTKEVTLCTANRSKQSFAAPLPLKNDESLACQGPDDDETSSG